MHVLLGCFAEQNTVELHPLKVALLSARSTSVCSFAAVGTAEATALIISVCSAMSVCLFEGCCEESYGETVQLCTRAVPRLVLFPECHGKAKNIQNHT